MPPRKRMKQLIKAEPALDNSPEIQQQTSAVEVLVEEQDQARVMKEQLLQAKVQLAELKAEITTKDSVIRAKDALLQSKELQLAQLKAEIRRLQATHPPPPPSDGVLVEVSTRTNSITSIANHASFFSFTGDGHSGGGVLLYRTTACPSLPLSSRLLLLLLLPRLLLMIIMKSSTLVTRMATTMTTQLHGRAVVRVYLRAAAW